MTMTPAELDLLHSRLAAARRYLEFGAGASTVHAAGLTTLERIDCVESSPEFIEQRVKPEPPVAAALAAGRLRFHIIDIGQTGDWGSPADDSRRHLWPNYPLGVFARPSDHDLVLVDGRFRVACALASALCTPDHAAIMIHDFHRVEYHVLRRYLEIEKQADTLVVFRRRPGVDRRRVQRTIAEYQYLPADNPARMRLKHAITRRLARPAGR
jgi:hypothetical protein